MLGVSAVSLIAAIAPLPLRSMQWLKADDTADGMVTAVNYRSGLCLADNASEKAKMGEVLFRSPSLFGGQAAKARLTCHSCHIDGGDNPYFHFPSISDEPGTADVSNSFFSAAGSNATFDPAVIPSLADPGKVSRNKSGELEAFVIELIVTEFSGQTPNDTVVAALAAYTREIAPCESAGEGADETAALRSSLEELIAGTHSAVHFAKQRNDAGDHQTAIALLAGARDAYGLIHERFTGKAHKNLRQDIAQASAALGALQLSNDPALWRRGYKQWQAKAAVLHPVLKRAEHASLFNDELLRSALQSGT